ncbi:hypothetical protein BDR05DRAFT_89174 [Suillus weaverae]|nr:hypothetical protein BDR05DRAFT_89174 [Suillus weaverae]
MTTITMIHSWWEFCSLKCTLRSILVLAWTVRVRTPDMVSAPTARYPFEVLNQGAVKSIFVDFIVIHGLIIDLPMTQGNSWIRLVIWQ